MQIACFMHPRANTGGRGHLQSGAATSLIYFKGHLYSGHSNGPIKMWDIKGQMAKMVREIKGHRRKITCFALYKAGDCLLSSSVDKSIKVWRMINRNLEPVDMVEVKEPILKMETYKQQMLIITPSPGLKVCERDETANVHHREKQA